MNNREQLYNIRAKVMQSVYWIRMIQRYYKGHIYRYGPIIKDDLFNSLFEKDEIVGVLAMEEKLGRPLKIEELEVSPLSVEHLTLGNLIITESEEEKRILDSFEALVEEKIRKEEGRAVTRLIKKLEAL